MPRTVTIAITIPDGPLDDEQDVKEAFRAGYRQWMLHRIAALNACADRRRAAGPIMGVVMSSDVARLGSLLPRDHWKAGTLRAPSETGVDDD